MSRKPIWAVCPICDSNLKGGSAIFFGCGIAKCPKGHYEYSPQGSYASLATIKLNDKEENFYFDDCFDDSKKFYARIDEIRKSKPPIKAEVDIIE